jgi:four helix bundle protein
MTKTPPDFGPRTFAFACQIVQLYVALNRIPGFPLGIARQILDAGTSIGANVEEGRAPSSRRDLAARFAISLREARETKFWLRLIRATDLAPANLTEGLTKEVDELVAILTVSVRKLRAG